jgi:DNA-binding NtrC family response regulator
MEKASILIVDDEYQRRRAIKAILKGKYNFDEAEDGEIAIAKLEAANYDLILTDMRMPKEDDGIEVIKVAKEQNPLTPVIVLTAYGTIENAVESIKAGAIDYIQLENMGAELEVKIKKALEHQQLALEHRSLRRQVEEFQQEYRLIGESDELKSVLKKIQKIQDSDCTVLIAGESGTGKECVARAIHGVSPRRNSPFFVCNCAAIPEGIAESLLWGSEKGIFTDAERREGYFELADHGVLFLDEIGEMKWEIQTKFLRVLEEKSFMRLGGKRQIHVDVRIIAATNKNLVESVRAGKFREDLYHRLNVVNIHVPPLRERKSDIPLLANYFLKEVFKSDKQLSDRALMALLEYPWPGNVRELKTCIERAVILNKDERILEPEHLFERENNLVISPKNFPLMVKQLVDSREYSEKEPLMPKLEAYTAKCMMECVGNQSRAAKLLGISEPILRKRLKEAT